MRQQHLRLVFLYIIYIMNGTITFEMVTVNDWIIQSLVDTPAPYQEDRVTALLKVVVHRSPMFFANIT